MLRMPGHTFVILLAVGMFFAAGACIGCVELACDYHSARSGIQSPSATDVFRAVAGMPAAVPPSAIAALIVVSLIFAVTTTRSIDGEPAVVPLRV